VLDAAEVPPTFGVKRSLVRALIAGGRKALEGAVEGAEDSVTNGAKDLLKAGMTGRDVVVGIAASGTTPYVLGALDAAKKAGAVTVGVTSNRKAPLARVADIAIAPNTGQEAVAGSTRLKAGTSQKMVLNLLSTATMVRLGRVYENWMIHLTLTNQKLEKRGTRILREATGASASTAARTLRQTGHDLPAAIVMLKAGVNAAASQRALAASRGNARLAIESLLNSQHPKKGRGK
jgi:N-acetylmuramic acid 6-phosphate etherase